MPIAASAAGLGKLTVISGLGEPLSAEIELLSTSKEELSSLTARIAPAEVFAAQGLERSSSLSMVNVAVGQRPDGNTVLRLTSSQPINDPFLAMLVQVEWSSGRLLREYTALLDPPGYGDRPVASSPETSGTEAPSVPDMATSPPQKTKGRHGAMAPSAMGEEAEAAAYTTHKGDTLHAIATQMQVDGVSLEQMLVGLYRANKDAFVGSNMNRLKVGQILRAPTQEELQAVDQKAAVKEIRVQTADWNAYRNKLAGMVAESAPAKEEASPQSVSGKITAPAEDKSVAPSAGPRDVVKLSKSESGASADLQGRLSSLQEEATAREKAIKESNERIASLEKQLQDMQKLLEVKNKSLADVQKGAKAPEPQPEPAKPEPVKPAPPAVEQKPEVQEPAAKPAEAAKPEAVKPEAKPHVKKPRKVVRPAPPPPAAEPGLLDNPLLLAGGLGGLLALAGGVWFYLRNRRMKGLDSFEQGILTSGGIKPNTVFGNTAGGTVDTGDTSFLTDFGQGAAAGMIDTNEVDPIAEAEVYMAYGRDVQAEEILKDAIAKEPKRYELHLKLLEIYAGRKDTGAFETLAGEMYAALGATDPIWAKVAEMGRRLEADNPLYAQSGTVAPTEVEPAGFDAAMIQQPVAEDTGDKVLDLGAGSEEATLDFSLDEVAAEAAPSSADTSAEGNTLDFDIGALELPAAETATASAASAEPVAELEFPLPEAAAPEVAESVAEAAGLDFQLDMPEPAAADNVQLDVADLGVGLGDMLPELPENAAVAAVAAAEAAGEISLELPELGASPVGEAALELPEPGGDTGSGQEAPGLSLDISLPDLELPELNASPEQAEITAKEENVQELAAPALDLSLPEMELPVAEEIALEMPSPAEEISLDSVTGMEALPSDLEMEGAAQEVSSLDIDLGELAPSLSAAEEVTESDQTVVLELPSEPEPAGAIAIEETPAATGEAVGLDFNFDAGLGDVAPQEEAAATATAVELPDMDLSGISLDIGEEASATGGATEEITLSSSESPDVDTKLDLVTAYIDMGDSEGARELLQEVLQEGGPTQREKAQKLLDGLG